MAGKITRRQFLKLAAGGILGLGATGTGGYVYTTHIEPYTLAVTRLTVPLRGLPRALDGLTLAQISDLHLGEWMTGQRMLDIAAQVNVLQPDVIAITGDFVSAIRRHTSADLTEAMRALSAPGGIYAILGNHDHWTNAATVTAAVEAAGVRMLRNEHVVIGRDDAALYLAGVDDIWERKHDLDAALHGIPADAPVILLAHEPDYADAVAADGRVALQLSGHSHGGQVRLPLVGALLLPYLGKKYDQGRYQIGDMTLYVNRGLGMVWLHVRFNCMPEITLLTLTTT